MSDLQFLRTMEHKKTLQFLLYSQDNLLPTLQIWLSASTHYTPEDWSGICHCCIVVERESYTDEYIDLLWLESLPMEKYFPIIKLALSVKYTFFKTCFKTVLIASNSLLHTIENFCSLQHIRIIMFFMKSVLFGTLQYNDDIQFWCIRSQKYI